MILFFSWKTKFKSSLKGHPTFNKRFFTFELTKKILPAWTNMTIINFKALSHLSDEYRNLSVKWGKWFMRTGLSYTISPLNYFFCNDKLHIILNRSNLEIGEHSSFSIINDFFFYRLPKFSLLAILINQLRVFHIGN